MNENVGSQYKHGRDHCSLLRLVTVYNLRITIKKYKPIVSKSSQQFKMEAK